MKSQLPESACSSVVFFNLPLEKHVNKILLSTFGCLIALLVMIVLLHSLSVDSLISPKTLSADGRPVPCQGFCVSVYDMD